LLQLTKKVQIIVSTYSVFTFKSNNPLAPKANERDSSNSPIYNLYATSAANCFWGTACLYAKFHLSI
jgi:hypothetical protein